MNTDMVALEGLLEGLTHAQLRALMRLIQERLSEPEDAESISDRAETMSGNGGGRKAARGHVELKMIEKWGPYAYLRWWEGKRLRSKYLGKVKG